MFFYLIGASRNIGYEAALLLLAKGHTCTFLLRRANTFEGDEVILSYIVKGLVRIIQGDATNVEDVKRGWELAGPQVDIVLFTLGATPEMASISVTKGIQFKKPNLCTDTLLNVLATFPNTTPQPRLMAVTSTGVGKQSHAELPFIYKPIYSWLLAEPHLDKAGMERLIAYCAGREWTETEPGPEILPPGWQSRLPPSGWLRSYVIIRPAMLTSGPLQGPDGKKGYRVAESIKGGWTVSRKDVAHWVAVGYLEDPARWNNKAVSIAY